MTNRIQTHATSLPHHRLIAYQVALEFITAVRELGVRERTLREQASRASISTALNIAEAAGREGAADKKRVFAIARGEATEAIAAIEIASAAGFTSAEQANACIAIGGRLTALLRGLIR